MMPLSLEVEPTLQPRERPATRPARVLVADDDPAMLELLVQSLGADGHEIVEATSGAELRLRLDALWLMGTPPDLVVSDVRMPGLSGLEVLAEMKADDRFAPVILITAFGDHDVHERARRLGVVAILDKPFDLGELRTLARRVLEGVRS